MRNCFDNVGYKFVFIWFYVGKSLHDDGIIEEETSWLVEEITSGYWLRLVSIVKQEDDIKLTTYDWYHEL